MVSFPTMSFPLEIQAYRPPMNATGIARIVSCDDTFAALSVSGEMFVFSVGTAAAGDGPGSRSASGTSAVRPQRVWALRKQFSAVKVRKCVFVPRLFFNSFDLIGRCTWF